MTKAPPLPASAFDGEGFLRNLSDWTPAVAEQIAVRENVVLSEAHWEVLNLLRRYYEAYADKGTSIYLLKLFPGSPAKIGSKIAGLPKPDNCL